MVLGSHWLVGAFFGDGATAEIIHLGQLYLWVTIPFYPFLLLLFIYRYTLQGLGNSLIPTIAGFIELTMRVLTALFIAPIWGYIGILVCHPLAWIGAFVPLMLAYYKTKKKVERDGFAPVVQ